MMAKVLSALCIVLSAICIAAGLPRLKFERPFGVLLVILFVIFVVTAFVFARLARKKHGEELGRTSRW